MRAIQIPSLLFAAASLALSACTPADPQQTTASETPAVTDVGQPTTAAVEASATPEVPAVPTATLAPDAWMSMPVIPEAVSPRVLEIYALGQSLGNDPRVFSRAGDCDSYAYSFLGDFDLGPQYYSLGEYTHLETVIEYFHGSFGLENITVRDGFSTASVLSPIWADPAQCQTGETPLACELRLKQPSFMIILLGTNDGPHKERFETNLRTILDYLIARGVVPILGTKGDNVEGDHFINAAIARLAYEYQVPFWNFWLAIQPLPNHGIRADDGYHPTWDENFFDDPVKMQFAFPWRNLGALQMLDLMMRSVNAQP